MRKARLGILVSALALGMLASACGSLKPPEECPYTGAKDEAAFAQYFSRMALVTEGATFPETGGDSDLTFSRSDKLELVAISLGETQLAVCIGERKGGGKVVYPNQTHSLSRGENRLKLGSFQPNPYVVRVAVGKVLVNNLTFSTK